jgi:ABC-type Fe3+-hydroxamate transport system substrate-binding protein
MGWGKSSLLAKAISQYQAKNIEVVCCSIDFIAVRTEEEFYKLFAEELLKATQSSIEKIQEALKNFLEKFIPRVSYGIDGINDMAIALDWKEVVKIPDQKINGLPYFLTGGL